MKAKNNNILKNGENEMEANLEYNEMVNTKKIKKKLQF